MNDKKTKELIKKLEWYSKFFKETSISNNLTEEERLVRIAKSEAYSEIVEIIKHDFASNTGKRSA